MIKDAINYLWTKATESTAVKLTETLDGRIYTKDKITIIDKPVTPGLTVYSLSGIVDYIKTQNMLLMDNSAQMLIHIQKHDMVYFYGPIMEASAKRPVIIGAECDVTMFDFDMYHSIDNFIVALLSRFEMTNKLENLVQFVSSLSHEQSASYEDNGVTQKVAVKKGITQKEQMEAPGRIHLAPHRIFAEVEQPASEFIFRIKLTNDNEPLCALFEADGGAWRIKARANIKQFFNDEIPSISVVA